MALGDELMAALPRFQEALKARQAAWQAQMAGMGPWGQRYARELGDYFREAMAPIPASARGTDSAGSYWDPNNLFPGGPQRQPGGAMYVAPVAPTPAGPSETDRRYQAGLAYSQAYEAYLNNPNSPAAQSVAYQAWQNAVNWGVPGVPAQFPTQPTGIGTPTDRQVQAGQAYHDAYQAYLANPASLPARRVAEQAWANARQWQVPGVPDVFPLQPRAPGQPAPVAASQTQAEASAMTGPQARGVPTAPAPATEVTTPGAPVAQGAGKTAPGAGLAAGPPIAGRRQGVGQTARQFGTWGGGFQHGGYVQPLAERLREALVTRRRPR